MLIIFFLGAWYLFATFNPWCAHHEFSQGAAVSLTSPVGVLGTEGRNIVHTMPEQSGTLVEGGRV